MEGQCLDYSPINNIPNNTLSQLKNTITAMPKFAGSVPEIPCPDPGEPQALLGYPTLFSGESHLTPP